MYTKQPSISMLSILALLVGGCINISARLQPEDTFVKAVKTGSDCVPIIFGFGFVTIDVEHATKQLKNPVPDGFVPVGGPIIRFDESN
jgi:hypothetical protein